MRAYVASNSIQESGATGWDVQRCRSRSAFGRTRNRPKALLICLDLIRWLWPLLFLFYFYFFIDKLDGMSEWSTIPACPSLMCSFNRGNIKGTNSSKICVWCLCLYDLCLQSDWFRRFTWQRVYMWEEFRNVYLLMTWVWLSWGDCVVDRTCKSNYYYHEMPCFTDCL